MRYWCASSRSSPLSTVGRDSLFLDVTAEREPAAAAAAAALKHVFVIQGFLSHRAGDSQNTEPGIPPPPSLLLFPAFSRKLGRGITHAG